MPLDSTGYLSPTSYGERDILFHRPVVTEQEQANSEQSVRARRAVDEDGEVLLRAAQIIEQDGWCSMRDDLNTGKAPACLMNAIGRASDYRNYNRFARRLGFEDKHAAFKWNDTVAMSAAEVIARLRSAAEQRA